MVAFKKRLFSTAKGSISGGIVKGVKGRRRSEDEIDPLWREERAAAWNRVFEECERREFVYVKTLQSGALLQRFYKERNAAQLLTLKLHLAKLQAYMHTQPRNKGTNEENSGAGKGGPPGVAASKGYALYKQLKSANEGIALMLKDNILHKGAQKSALECLGRR